MISFVDLPVGAPYGPPPFLIRVAPNERVALLSEIEGMRTETMRVRVSGKQIEIGTALPQKVREKLGAAIAKHFDGGADAHVVISRERVGFRADCSAHLDSGLVLKAEGEGEDAYRAFEAALDHLEKQVRRYKRRLKNHHEKAKAPKRVRAQSPD